MTTPTPDGDSATERFEPLPPGQLPPPSAPLGQQAPQGAPVFAPPAAPPAQPMFAAPEPGGLPTEPVRPTSPGIAAAPARPAGARPGGSTRILNVVLGVAVLIAVAGIAFAAGRTTAPQTASSNAIANAGPFDRGIGGNGGAGPLSGGPNLNGNGNGNGNGGPGGDIDGGRGFGRGLLGAAALGIQGTVESVTANSVTIRTPAGLTITVGTDASTTYHQQADASASAVQPGTTVIVGLSGGGFRPGAGSAANGSVTLGTAGSITVVP